MEQVYYSNPRDSSETKNVDWRKRMSKCSISCRNTMAFAAQIPSPVKTESRFKITVIDLNIPWEHHQVAVHSEMITCIEWDSQGLQLMVCDTVGTMLIFRMEGNILNHWTLIHARKFRGESLLGGIWFHNGKKIEARIHGEEAYLMKYARVQFSSSLKPPLNNHADGCLAISEFGAVCVIMLPKNEKEVPRSAVHRLFAIPCRLRSVDVCHASTGDFLVAAHVCSASFVNFFRITVTIEERSPTTEKLDPERGERSSEGFDQTQETPSDQAESVETPANSAEPGSESIPSSTMGASEADGNNFGIGISVNPISSLFPASLADGTPKCVTHLRFLYRENPGRLTQPDTSLGETPHGIIVSVSDATKSTLELWMLQVKGSLCALPEQPERRVLTLKWQQVAARECHTFVIAMATPRRYCFDNQPVPTQIVVAFDDYTIQRLQGDDLDGEATLQICPGPPPEKLFPQDSLDMCFSKTGSILMVVDAFNCQLSMFRTGVFKGLPSDVATNIQYSVSLFECCIMASEDWLDVVLGLDRGSVPGVLASFSKNYERQPPRIRMHCSNRFRALLGDLYRLSDPRKEGEQFAKLLLKDVCAAITNAPRNRLGFNELSKLIRDQDPIILDIDEVISGLRRFDFSVTRFYVSQLRNHIQWITDLALNCALPFWRRDSPDSVSREHGLIADNEMIHLVREALVIIRIWERKERTQLTTYPDSVTDFETVAVVFNLLTAALAYGPLPPPEEYAEAWALLEFRLSNSKMKFHGSASGGLCCENMYSRSLPVTLEYDEPPDFMPESGILYSAVDCYISEPAIPGKWWAAYYWRADDKLRRCTRCFRLLLLRCRDRWQASKLWEERWSQVCPCGGRWALIPVSSLKYANWESVLP